MGNGYVKPRGDQMEVLADALRGLARRIAELEAPTGTSVNSLVDQVQQAIANINTTVNAAIAANSYTKTQIDTKIASPGNISPGNVTASGFGSFGGAGTFGGAGSFAGTLSATGALSTGGQFNCLDAYNFDITYTRRTAWLGNDGRLGFASSSRDKKTSILPADFDIPALLAVGRYSFFYRAEIARRTQLRIAGIDLDYRPQREIGLMAEELAAAGYEELVYFDEDGKPEGIEYSMLTVPLLSAVSQLAQDRAADRALITDLSARLAVLEGKTPVTTTTIRSAT
jgi:hypothetical protein